MTTLRDYQKAAVEFVDSRFFINQQPGAYLAADCGMGKTLITLEIIHHLKCLGECKRVLILAPLTVVDNVWEQEAKKHGYDFTFDVCHGTNKLPALHGSADIVLINYEGLLWLNRQTGFEFDLLVLDEATRVKTWMAKSVRALRRHLHRFRWRLALSGTPSPRSLGDLHSQIYMLDNGEALGQTVGWFRQRFMRSGGYQGREWFIRRDRQDAIYEAVKDIVFRLSADDYLDIPPALYNQIMIDMPRAAMRQYRTLERELFVELASGQTLTASGAGAKYSACKMLANGGMYETEGDDRIYHNIHDAKMLAVESVVTEAAGKPVLVVYQTHRDREHLTSRRMFRDAPSIHGGVPRVERTRLIDSWNLSEIPILLCQPQSMSHGLNMQHGEGRDIIWLGLSDSLETYSQLNARILRSGVTGQVRIHHILCRGTVDIPISRRLLDKDRNQRSLLDTLNEYRRSQE